jgi:elongation factor G
VDQGELEDEFGEDKLFSIQSMSFPLLFELEQQIKAALTRGCLKSYRMVGIRASLISGEYTNRRTNELAIGKCVNQLVRDLVGGASPIVLEPLMNIEISSPNEIMQTIMNDLVSTRRGLIDQIGEDQNRFGKHRSDRSTIKGTIPLQETIGYSTFIRSISQGEASFNI